VWGAVRLGLLAANLFFIVCSAKESLYNFWAPGIFILGWLLLNLYYLAMRPDTGDWLALWMKRKKLEEEKRIRDLEEQTQN
jgi:hypothetical protein